MNQSFKLLQSKSTWDRLEQACEAAIYMHPSDLMNDPKLTLRREKRAVLASWISDARAVENAPALRQLDSGAVVEVDAIRQALVFLDKWAAERIARLPSSGRRRSVLSKWLRDSNDNDDDPPPAPAGFGIPFGPPLWQPTRARPKNPTLAQKIGGRTFVFRPPAWLARRRRLSQPSTKAAARPIPQSRACPNCRRRLR